MGSRRSIAKMFDYSWLRFAEEDASGEKGAGILGLLFLQVNEFVQVVNVVLLEKCHEYFSTRRIK